ncbi:MAG: hypothetical protein ACYTG0_24435, partial [Planctomycetota bacterium]
ARYFVMHLSERDLGERGRASSEGQFEIQLLDAEGRAKACGYVGSDETTLEVEGKTVPIAVIEAARQQPVGQGDYVDEQGHSIQPF